MSPYHIAYTLIGALFIMGLAMIFHAPPADSRTMMGGLLTALAAALIKICEVIEKVGHKSQPEDDQADGGED